jgi:microcystin-dependent protein
MSGAYVGEIRLFAGVTPPAGWLICNGQELNISGNEPLFTLLGTTYGGDGVHNFAIPDLTSTVPVHYGQGSPNLSAYALGATGGQNTVTLTPPQAPSHTHTFSISAAAADTYSPADGPVTLGTTMPNTAYANGPMQAAPLNLGSTSPWPFGAAQPHENRMCTMTLNFMICVQGLTPPQP